MKRNQMMTALAAVLCLGLSGPVLAQSTTHAGDKEMVDSSQPGTDTWITTKVKSDLLASKGVSGTDVSVETKDGVVWLSGHTATQAEKDRTVAKAKAIEGVKKVDASKLMVGEKKM